MADLNKVSWRALFTALESVGIPDAVVGESSDGEIVVYTRKKLATDSKGHEYLTKMEDM